MNEKLGARQTFKSFKYRALLAFLKNLMGICIYYSASFIKPLSEAMPILRASLLMFFGLYFLSWFLFHIDFISKAFFEGYHMDFDILLESNIFLPEPSYLVVVKFRPLNSTKKFQELTFNMEFQNVIDTYGNLDHEAVETYWIHFYRNNILLK